MPREVVITVTLVIVVEAMVTFVVKIAVMIVDEVMVAMIVGYTDNKNSLSNICLQLIHLETWFYLILSMGVGYKMVIYCILCIFCIL